MSHGHTLQVLYSLPWVKESFLYLTKVHVDRYMYKENPDIHPPLILNQQHLICNKGSTLVLRGKKEAKYV